MADDNTIFDDIDFSSLAAQFSEIESHLAKLRKNFKDLDQDSQRSIRNMIRDAKAFGRALDNVQDAQDGIGVSGAASLRDLVKHMVMATKSASETKAILGELGVSGRYVSEEVDKTSKSMSGFSKATSAASKATGDFSSILDATKLRTFALGASLKNITEFTASYQKTIYNSVRAAQIFGQTTDQARGGLKRMGQAVGLNEKIAASFYKTWTDASNGMAPTTKRMEGFIKSIGDEFGNTQEDIDGVLQSFGKLQSLQIGIDMSFVEDLRKGFIDNITFAEKLADMRLLNVDRKTIEQLIRMKEGLDVDDEARELKSMSDLIAHIGAIMDRFVAQNGEKLKAVIQSFAMAGEMAVNVLSKIPGPLLAATVGLTALTKMGGSLAGTFTKVLTVVSSLGGRLASLAKLSFKNLISAAGALKNLGSFGGDGTLKLKMPSRGGADAGGGGIKGLISSVEKMFSGSGKCIPVCSGGGGSGGSGRGFSMKRPVRSGGSVNPRGIPQWLRGAPKMKSGGAGKASQLLGKLSGGLGKLFTPIAKLVKGLRFLANGVRILATSLSGLVVAAQTVAAAFSLSSKATKKVYGGRPEAAEASLNKVRKAQQTGDSAAAKRETLRLEMMSRKGVGAFGAVGGGAAIGALVGGAGAAAAALAGLGPPGWAAAAVLGVMAGTVGAVVAASKESAKITKSYNVAKMNEVSLSGKYGSLTKQEIAAIQKKNEAMFDEIRAAKYGTGIWGQVKEYMDREMPLIADSFKALGEMGKDLGDIFGYMADKALGAAEWLAKIASRQDGGHARQTYEMEMQIHAEMVNAENYGKKLEEEIRSIDIAMGDIVPVDDTEEAKAAAAATIDALKKKREGVEARLNAMSKRRLMQEMMLTDARFKKQKEQYMKMKIGGASRAELDSMLQQSNAMAGLREEAEAVLGEEQKRRTTIANINKLMDDVTNTYRSQSEILGQMLSAAREMYNLSLKASDSGFSGEQIGKVKEKQDELREAAQDALFEMQRLSRTLTGMEDGDRTIKIKRDVETIEEQEAKLERDNSPEAKALKASLKARKEMLQEMLAAEGPRQREAIHAKYMAKFQQEYAKHAAAAIDTEKMLGTEYARQREIVQSNVDLGRQQLELAKSFMGGIGLTYEMQMEQIDRVRSAQDVVEKQIQAAHRGYMERSAQRIQAEEHLKQLEASGSATQDQIARAQQDVREVMGKQEQALLQLNKYKAEGLQLAKEEVELTKELRYGYLSAMQSQAMSAGTFSKILFTRDQHVGKMLEMQTERMKKLQKDTPGYGAYVAPLGGKYTEEQAQHAQQQYAGGFAQHTTTGFRGSRGLAGIAKPWFGDNTAATMESRFGRQGQAGAGAAMGGAAYSAAAMSAQQFGVALGDQLDTTRAITGTTQNYHEKLVDASKALADNSEHIQREMEQREKVADQLAQSRPAATPDIGAGYSAEGQHQDTTNKVVPPSAGQTVGGKEPSTLANPTAGPNVACVSLDAQLIADAAAAGVEKGAKAGIIAGMKEVVAGMFDVSTSRMRNMSLERASIYQVAEDSGIPALKSGGIAGHAAAGYLSWGNYGSKGIDTEMAALNKGDVVLNREGTAMLEKDHGGSSPGVKVTSSGGRVLSFASEGKMPFYVATGERVIPAKQARAFGYGRLAAYNGAGNMKPQKAGRMAAGGVAEAIGGVATKAAGLLGMSEPDSEKFAKQSGEVFFNMIGEKGAEKGMGGGRGESVGPRELGSLHYDASGKLTDVKTLSAADAFAQIPLAHNRLAFLRELISAGRAKPEDVAQYVGLRSTLDEYYKSFGIERREWTARGVAPRYAGDGFPGMPKGIDTERYMLGDGDVVLNREATAAYRKANSGKSPGKMVTPSGGRVTMMSSGGTGGGGNPFYVASGESIIPASQAKSIGYGTLAGMNAMGNVKKQKAGRMEAGGTLSGVTQTLDIDNDVVGQITDSVTASVGRMMGIKGPVDLAKVLGKMMDKKFEKSNREIAQKFSEVSDKTEAAAKSTGHMIHAIAPKQDKLGGNLTLTKSGGGKGENKHGGQEKTYALSAAGGFPNLITSVPSNVVSGFSVPPQTQVGTGNNVSVGGISIGYQYNENKSKSENDEALLSAALTRVEEELRGALLKEQKQKVI